MTLKKQPKYLIIDESPEILALFYTYCRLEYEDELWDMCRYKIKNAIDSFNNDMKFLMEYINDNYHIVFDKPHWLTCPSGVNLEFYLSFIDFYETTVHEDNYLFNSLPTLVDKYGTTHYLGDYSAIKY